MIHPTNTIVHKLLLTNNSRFFRYCNYFNWVSTGNYGGPEWTWLIASYYINSEAAIDRGNTLKYLFFLPWNLFSKNFQEPYFFQKRYKIYQATIIFTEMVKKLQENERLYVFGYFLIFRKGLFLKISRFFCFETNFVFQEAHIDPRTDLKFLIETYA